MTEIAATVLRPFSECAPLFQQHPLPMWVFDVATLRFLAVNDAAVEAYGYSREAFLQMTLHDIRTRQHQFVLDGVGDLPSRDVVVIHTDHAGRERIVRIFARAVEFEGRRARIVAALDVGSAVEGRTYLEQVEGRYRQAFECAPSPMAMAHLDGRWMYANPAMCGMLGYSMDELAHLSVAAVTHPEDRAHAAAQDALLISGKREVVETARRYVRKDGTIVWVRSTASVARGDAGLPLYFIVQGQDITAESMMQEKLEASEQQHRLLFETMAEGVLFHDRHGRITEANEAALRILGKALVYRDGANRLAAGYRTLRDDGSEMPEAERPWNVALRAGSEVRDVEMAITCDEEEPRWIRVNAIPGFVAADGRVQQVYATFSDITQLRRAEADRRATEERFRALVEYAAEMVLVVDEQAALVFVSESSRNVLGYPSDQVMQRKALSFLHPDDVGRAQSALKDVLQRPGEMVSCEIRARHRSGDWRVLACTVRNMLGHPSLGGIIINARDITDKRRAEETLQQREEELRQAQKMEAVARLAGGIAHDFNNVLTAINGHAAFLAERFESSDVQSDIDGIRVSADRAARLTRQLLAFSRRQMLQATAMDLRDVVTGLHPTLQRLSGDLITLTTKLPDAPALIHADRSQIEQVVLNLAINACEAMSTGGHLLIEVVCAEADVAPRWVTLRVRDTGVGIPTEVQDKIFEPFFTTKDLARNGGLGLSTVYGIVKQSGGDVVFESEVGRGACFEVRLPVHQVAHSREPIVRPESKAFLRGGGETVLLVEDEASVRAMAERVLRRQGYRVLSAVDGAEALRLLEAIDRAVDLLVTDVVMPVMSGPELAATVSARHPEIPIIFMSGYTADEINEEGIKAAGAAFLPKPFAPHDLAKLVRATLDKKATGS